LLDLHYVTKYYFKSLAFYLRQHISSTSVNNLDVSNKVAATSRFDCLCYLSLHYSRYLRSTTGRT